ncbi:hypothetical protein CLU79DRAFT_72131 [Phycomyces nitens]|nr:hypothetical protein CLU79DRAFT_72131 [Phycomyces nitens]
MSLRRCYDWWIHFCQILFSAFVSHYYYYWFVCCNGCWCASLLVFSNNRLLNWPCLCSLEATGSFSPSLWCLCGLFDGKNKTVSPTENRFIKYQNKPPLSSIPSIPFNPLFNPQTSPQFPLLVLSCYTNRFLFSAFLFLFPFLFLFLFFPLIFLIFFFFQNT